MQSVRRCPPPQHTPARAHTPSHATYPHFSLLLACVKGLPVMTINVSNLHEKTAAALAEMQEKGPLELSGSQFPSGRSLDGQHATFADKVSEGGLTAEVATEVVGVASGGGNGGGDGGCGFLEGRLGPLELSGSQFPSGRSLDGQHATFAGKFSEGGLKEPSTKKLRPPAAACWKASCSAF